MDAEKVQVLIFLGFCGIIYMQKEILAFVQKIVLLPNGKSGREQIYTLLLFV